MKPTRNWIKLSATLWAVVMLSAMSAGQARAATYNIMLKDQNSNPVPCAIGGFSGPTEFSFDKTTAGQFAVNGLSVTVAANCISGVNGNQTFNQSSTVAVQVRTSVLNKPGTGCAPPNYNQPGCKYEDLNQGPNVEGLGGFAQADGSVSTKPLSQYPRYRLTFSYADTQASRTWKIDYLEFKVVNNQRVEVVTPVANGKYHVRNTQSIPEPQTIFLMVAGLGGLLLTRRTRRPARN